MFFCSCSEGNTGRSISAVDIEIIKDSSFVVTGESVKVEKIQSRTINQLLGKIKAENYGVLSSDFVTQLMPAVNIDTAGVTTDFIDSIKLSLRIPKGGFFGDSIIPMSVKAYRLTKTLPSPIFSDFNVSEYVGDLLGSASYTASALGMKDSVKNLNYREVSVKLPVELARSMFTEYKNNKNTFSSPSAFSKFFPGLYVTTSFGSGRVMNIENTTVDVYYRKKYALSEEKDTIYNLNASYLATTPEVVTNSNITMTVDDAIKAKIDAGDAMIVAPAGYEVKIKLPSDKLIEKIEEIISRDKTIGVLNELYFQVPAVVVKNDYDINPPANLLLVKASERDEFFTKKKINDNVTSFTATYSDGYYTFSEMRNYILDLYEKLKSGEIKELTDDDMTFILMPVNIESETNSYYGTSTVIRIVPYINAPAIVMLDIPNAKLRLTLSRQTVLF